MIDTTTRAVSEATSDGPHLEARDGQLYCTATLPVPDLCHSASAEVRGSETQQWLEIDLTLDSHGMFCAAVSAVVELELRVPQLSAGTWSVVVRSPTGTVTDPVIVR